MGSENGSKFAALMEDKKDDSHVCICTFASHSSCANSRKLSQFSIQKGPIISRTRNILLLQGRGRRRHGSNGGVRLGT